MNSPHVEIAMTTPPLIGFAALMRKVFAEKDLKPLAAELSARAAHDPNDANALMDLSTILLLNFQRDIGVQIQAEALKIQRLFSIEAPLQPAKLRLLVMMAEGDLSANTPVEALLEESDIELHLLYLSPNLPFPEQVPDHDVLLIAICESDENMSLLHDLKNLPSLWPRPVINLPEKIAQLSRDNVAAVLGNTQGIVMPAAVRVSRHALIEIADQQRMLDSVLAQGVFPIIIRPVDSHAGHGLAKIEHAAALPPYLNELSEDEFFISPFVDYRSADGQFRKYRVMLIDGKPYVSHLAISSNWMIHYLNAGMADSAEKRAEEARCFETFDASFATRHASALQLINERMGLEYVGIDCAEMPSGELLIFEVDSAMVVHAFDPVDLYPYKQPQMKKIFAAFRDLLLKAANQKN